MLFYLRMKTTHTRLRTMLAARHKVLGNLVGWGVFFLSLAVYFLTAERTAGYWDCGEFVLSSYKLQVPHAPGAPFYLLVGRLFSMLATTPTQVAFFVNLLSVLASAFTIFFLFWTIVLLARRMISLSFTDLSTDRSFALAMVSGVIGALAYAFSDTFWSSAVETEVYALSSLLMAIIVWAALRWEMATPTSRPRWMIFTAYMLGLSLGVHLLALLSLPALCFLFYYRKKNTLHLLTSWLLCLLGLAIIVLIVLGITRGIPEAAFALDLYFVNTLSLPFNSGAITLVALLMGSLLFCIFYTHKRGYVRLHVALLMVHFMLIGYASYMLILIRAAQDPPINENSPKTLPRFLSYLAREQYGDRPLLYGKNYTAKPIGQVKKSPVYDRKKGSNRYQIVDYQHRTIYDHRHATFFPRLYSEDHAKYYEEILPHLKAKPVPSFMDNVSFFLRYQLSHMYLRYFLWNFSGREGHKRGADWLSAADALQSVPTLMRADKARNTYFMLPLFLGILGLFFHCLYDVKRFSFVLLLFLLTGVGLAVYLNMPPFEPRERDYIYAGSFYAFSVWIGLFFTGLLLTLRHKVSWRAAFAVFSLLGVSTVVLLCYQNWDDHNRAARYFSVDSAKNVLASCAPNAILFTGGDNDTFPLWYVQEVEGFRTDVRVIVFSYFNTDWYIAQMMRPVYASAAVPLSLSLADYEQGGSNDFLPVYDLSPDAADTAYHDEYAVDLGDYLSMLRARDPAIHLTMEDQSFHFVPGKWFVWDVKDAHEKVERLIPEHYRPFLADKMKLRIKTDYLEKKDLAILDLLHTNQWERPIYFNHTSLKNFAMDIQQYVIQEGLLFRLLPVEDQRPAEEKDLFGDFLVHTDHAYNNLLHGASYRGLDDPSIHYTEDYERFVFSYRSAFLALANALIAEEDYNRAEEVLLYCLRVLPDAGIPYDLLHHLEMVSLFLTLDAREQAVQIADVFSFRADEMLDYLFSLRGEEILSYARDFYESKYVLEELEKIFAFYEETEQSMKYRALLVKHGLVPVES